MRVFISYRRLDSQEFVDLLETKLRERLAGVEIFRDIGGIEAGENWKEKITGKVESSDIMLVIIGPDWLTTEKNGERRLFDPDDVVRLEISLGLSSNVSVVPILIQGASFPAVENLPGDIQHLSWFNAHHVRPTSLDDDINRLIKRLGLMLGTTIQEEPTPERRRTASDLIEELGELIERDPKVKDFESYWCWFLRAKQSLREAATGTQVEAEMRHLELLLSEARDDDQIAKELTMLEIKATLDTIRAFFSTSEEREEDEESDRQTTSEGIHVLPGVALEKFPIDASWQCDVTSGMQAISILFNLAKDGTVTGSLTSSGRTSRMDAKWALNIWKLPEEERYVGEPPKQIVGIRLSGLLNGHEPFDFEIPIAEKLGEGYRGSDEQGRTYFLRRQ